MTVHAHQAPPMPPPLQGPPAHSTPIPASDTPISPISHRHHGRLFGSVSGASGSAWRLGFSLSRSGSTNGARSRADSRADSRASSRQLSGGHSPTPGPAAAPGPVASSTSSNGLSAGRRNSLSVADFARRNSHYHRSVANDVAYEVSSSPSGSRTSSPAIPPTSLSMQPPPIPTGGHHSLNASTPSTDFSTGDRPPRRPSSSDRWRQHTPSVRAHDLASSAASSASVSKPNSSIGTPRLLSREGSKSRRQQQALVNQAPGATLPGSSTSNAKAKAREEVPALSEGGRSPHSDTEVIETPQLVTNRDPETGRKMINQYLVLQELGKGTHGQVRLGQDMTVDQGPDDQHDPESEAASGAFWAIKIVDRNPKRKRLNALSRRNRNSDGGKLVAENEIRKEIAILKKLHHPNVVRMKEIIDDPESSKLFMILEYCNGGEVRWKNPETGGPDLTIDESRQIFRDTLLGLEYLHHQGIIHRDIKPSNLLFSGDRVKISDFGCSHFSEALFAAATADSEAYVDDIELAKTAGSPAFFAPEMCYSEFDDTATPQEPSTADESVPQLTVRPPSAALDEHTSTSTTHSDVLRPDLGVRTDSVATLARKPRHPITNAIDVWALGVTLYCLLFGTTPFDAANEYLLMQAIPTAAYAIPPTMGADALPTSGDAVPEEVIECLDLLSKLLEKDASKRISLEKARRHPYTLRGLPDPQGWLASTDLHNSSYVTVTADEVSAAVSRATSIRARFRRGMAKFSRLLTGRSRGDGNAEAEAAGDHSNSSTDGGGTRRVTSGGGGGDREPAVAAGALARRLSVLSRDRSRAESPRPAGLLAAQMDRAGPAHVADPDRRTHSALASNASSTEATPRQMPSITSLDKYRIESPPSSAFGRRASHDVVSMEPRPRSTSNASSASSLFGALGRNIFHRDRNVRSNGSSAQGLNRRQGGPSNGSGSNEDHGDSAELASSMDSNCGRHFPQRPETEFMRGRSYDELRRRSRDTFDSGSPSSRHMAPSPDHFGSWRHGGMLADQLGLPVRRGSTLSEDITGPVLEDEEIDWAGGVPDSDDEADSLSDFDRVQIGGPSTVALHARLTGGGVAYNSSPGLSSSQHDWNSNQTGPDLHARSPSDSILQRISPPSPRGQSLLRPGGGIDIPRGSNGSGSTTHGQPSAHSYIRPGVPLTRAKSPLGRPVSERRDADAVPEETLSPDESEDRLDPLRSATPSRFVGIPTSSYSSYPGPYGSYSSADADGGNSSVGYGYHGSHSSSFAPSTPDRFADAEDDDDGLVLGRRRGRKGSMLSRGSSVLSSPQ